VTCGFQKNGERIDRTIGTCADNVVDENTRAFFGKLIETRRSAPGRSNVTTLQTDDCTRKACLEQSCRGILDGTLAGAVQTRYCGSLFVCE